MWFFPLTHVCAQGRITLVIDTLVTVSDGFTPRQYDGKFRDVAEDTSTKHHRLDVYHSSAEYPNIVSSILRSAEAGPLRLDLDEHGGELLLRWSPDFTGDTIRIERFEVYWPCRKNVYEESTEKWAWQDTAWVLEKHTFRKGKVHGARRAKQVHYVDLRINGRPYRIYLRLEEMPQEAVLSNGFDTRDCQDPRDAKAPRKCRRFHRQNILRSWGYRAALLLDK
jgi:hypothetical protein